MPIERIDPIENGESGASVRQKLNKIIKGAVDGTLGVVTREEIENLLDLDPPEKVENLRLDSTLEPSPTLIASWHPSLASDFSYYDLQLKEAEGGSWLSFPTTETVYTIAMMPATGYYGRVRAVDKSGNPGDFSDEVFHFSARDNIPPATPVGLKAKGTFNAAWLEWEANTESDLARYEIFEGEDESFVPDVDTKASFMSLSTTFVRSGLEDGVERWYWLRAVDTSDNASQWSSPEHIETLSGVGEITTDDLQGLIDATSFASSIAIPGWGDALPSAPFDELTPKTFYLRPENTIYRQKADGSGWTKDVDATQIVGKLVAGQIATAAIGTEQLAAKAVIAEKMLLGDTSNSADRGWSEGDISAWGTAGRLNFYEDELEASQMFGSWLLVSNTRNQAQSPTISVVPGDKWYAEAWCYNPSAEDAEVYFVTYGPNGEVGYQSVSSDVKNGWARIGEQFIVPANHNRAGILLVVDRADGTTGSNTLWTKPLLRKTTGSILLENGVVTSEKVSTGEVITLSAQIKNAIINDAHVIELSAAKLKANTALLGSLTVGGAPLSTISANAALGAQDPAQRINNASTQIDPGKVVISGATTLANWRGQTDTTKIFGGNLETNTIQAISLRLGNFSNLADEGWSTGSFDSWLSEGFGAFYADTGGPSELGGGGYTLQSNGFNQGYIQRFIPVVPGETLNGYVWVLNGHAARVVYYVQWFNAQKGYITSSFLGYTDAKWIWTKIGGTQVVAPTGAAFFRVTLQREASGGDYTYWNTPTIYKAYGGELIVDGSITTPKMRAGAVTADILGAGSVAAGKLAVGIAGNMLRNSDFSAGMSGWGIGYSNDPMGQSFIRVRADNYGVLPYGSLEVVYDGTNGGVVLDAGTFDTQGYLKSYACIPGEWLEISGYHYGHRCKGLVVFFQFYDAFGNYISNVQPDQPFFANQNGNPNFSLSAYARHFSKAQVPPNAVFVRPYWRNAGFADGQQFSYLWLKNLYFGKATQHQNEPTPWADGSQTLINGGDIRAVSLSVISANLGAITGGSMNINNRFIVASDGTTTIQSGFSGARMVQTNSRLDVYDGNGVLRVRIGQL